MTSSYRIVDFDRTCFLEYSGQARDLLRGIYPKWIHIQTLLTESKFEKNHYLIEKNFDIWTGMQWENENVSFDIIYNKLTIYSGKGRYLMNFEIPILASLSHQFEVRFFQDPGQVWFGMIHQTGEERAKTVREIQNGEYNFKLGQQEFFITKMGTLLKK